MDLGGLILPCLKRSMEECRGGVWGKKVGRFRDYRNYFDIRGWLLGMKDRR